MRDMNWIRHYLSAGNPKTSVNKLEKLAKHKDAKIRCRVAENSGAPESILRFLAEDKTPEVRLAVASNRNCTQALLRQLAKDLDPTVRFGLAEDPHMPENILYMLSEDENGYVSHRATKTLENLGALKTFEEPINIFRGDSRRLYA